MEFKLYVLFGDGEKHYRVYEFATEAERAAFQWGMNEMDGWGKFYCSTDENDVESVIKETEENGFEVIR